MMPMNEGNLIEVKIKELLEFFDEAPKDSKKHATSVVAVAGEELGIALLVQHLKDKGNKSAEMIGDRCTPGTNKGSRLDAWVSTGNDSVLYQVEVKNWSAHAIGGKVFPKNAENHIRYRQERWNAMWDGNGFTNPSVSKVLEEMKKPTSIQFSRVEPLVVFWTALHPDGAEEPFFKVPVKSEEFDVVNVFSMANYLRQQIKETETLRLEMPTTCRRLDWLSRLFKKV